MRQLCCLLVVFAFLFFGHVKAEEPVKPLPPDVRVVIDISGSMKKTDPQNLRKPAVDLVVRLLPDNSKAGIWTFGQSVNMLVPHKMVDQNWRDQATQKASSINSIAMFTNIGGALEKAAEDYATPASDYRRNIILLTDGVVDINKEAVVNLNERKRVLTELLPRLKTADYRIHTIALSADSDQELMKKLSVATDGISEVADTADELMSTFLRIFDQAVPAERVPLDENGFLVDSSIQEFTALIFRRAEVPSTIIIGPDGKEFSGTDPKQNVNWYRTDRYDLITVQAPQAGQWKVKTEMAPGSRVTVVSNLQLVVQPMKSNIKSGQPLDLVYSFQENGQIITNKDFLTLLNGDALISGENSPEVSATALTMGAPADGIFRQQLQGFSGRGRYDVKILIDGKTFKREFVHHLNISDSSFKLEKSLDESSGKKIYSYKLIPDIEAVDVGATSVMAIIKNSKENNLERELNIIGNQHWEFSFTPVQTAHYDISLNINSKQIDGSPLSETISADSFYFPDEASVTAVAQPASVSASSVTASEPAAEEPTPTVEEEEGSSVWLYVGIGIGNLVVLVLGFLVYRLIAGGKDKDDNEIEKTLKTDVSSLQKPAPSPEKTVIDVSDESDMGTIPMSDNQSSNIQSGNTQPDNTQPGDIQMPDDLMADNLFPLDNMEDPGDKDKT